MQKYYFKKGVLGRSAIGAIFCSIILLSSMAAAISITDKESQDNEVLSYTFLFKEPNQKSVSLNNQNFLTLDMEGCMAIGKDSGEPAMPVKPISLLLPPGKEVEKIIVIGSPVKIDIGENIIIPHQNPVPIGSSQGEFVKSDIVYSKNEFYPGRLQDEYQIGYSRGYAILSMPLNPVQYNPVKGKLEYYPEMTVNIELKDTSEINQFFRNNPNDRDWVENLVYNADVADLYSPDLAAFSYDGGLCDPIDNYDYVIITTTHEDLDYWETSSSKPYNWESLMDKHQLEDGLSCTLVTIQDIDACEDYFNDDPLFNDQEAHIREFCKDAYEDWGTEYILIGGDDEWINARHMRYQYESNVDSDIYWSNLDNTFNEDHDNYWGEEGDSGFDLYTELYIGRLTCDNPQDVSNWMTKSFYYADSMDEEYLDNTGFYGGDTGWNCQGDDFVDYCAIKGTDNWLGPNPGADGPFPTWAGFQFGFETWNDENPDNTYDMDVMWTAEPPNPGWQGGGTGSAITGFRTAINNDEVTIISAIAHANANMAMDVSSSEWENNYHNTEPFFAHDFGCHCGDMDAADDGVLHSMLFHSDTELAFGVVFNTCYGWGNFDTTNSSSAFQAKEFWSYFLDLEDKSGSFLNWQFGKGHAYSKDRMAPTINWDPQYGTWRSIIQGCLLFADPAQKMRSPHPSEPPTNPNAPDGPGEWVQDLDATFTAVTTDPEGDQIYYMFNWGDGTFSEWLGPYASNQEVSEEHIWSELGTYKVKVLARDIWGAVSEWSLSHNLEIIENGAPDKPVINGPSIVQANRGYTYTVSAEDPQDHDVYYYIWWGDGGYVSWDGPYKSGETVSYNNAWPEPGSYTINVKAMDFIGDKSITTTLKITVTRDRSVQNFFLQKLLERLGQLFPILEELLNL